MEDLNSTRIIFRWKRTFSITISTILSFTGSWFLLPEADSTVNVDSTNIPAFQFNQQKAKLAGLELKIDIHPHPLDWLHIENSFSYVRGLLKTEVDGSKNIPFIPAARLITELRGDLLRNANFVRNFSVRAELDNTFSQKKPFTGFNTETATSGYTLINAGVSADIISKKEKIIASDLF